MQFDPWTADFSSAERAQRGYTGHSAEGPIFQWVAAQTLRANREKIESGDGFGVLQAVAKCALHALVMPDWLAKVFLRRYRAVQQLNVPSWDDEHAFGRPHPKGTQLAAQRRNRMNRLGVKNLVHDYQQLFPEQSLDALWKEFDRGFKRGEEEHSDMDADIASRVRRFGFASTKAQELFYEAAGTSQNSASAKNKSAKPAKSRKLAGRRKA